MSMKTRGGSPIFSPESKPVTAITGCTILTPLHRIENSAIIMRGEEMDAIGSSLSIPGGSERHSFRGCLAVPGFIDIHFHGASGINFNDAGPDEVIKALRTHLSQGTTACLPTLMTAREPVSLKAIAAILEARESANELPSILGINMEGPFISEEKRGVHEKCSIHRVTYDEIKAYMEASRGLLRIVTVAPEKEGAPEFIGFLNAHGIIASAGHTNAGYEVTEGAVRSGVRLATHLFNAMRGIHQREPGAAGALLLDDRVYAELIADGEHIHPALFRLVLRTKGIKRIIIITDSSPDYGNSTVATRTRTGVLVGSTLPLPESLKLFLKHSDLSLQEGLRTITLNPAMLLGIERRQGVIRKGAAANVVILDRAMKVKAVFLKGRRIL